MKKIKSSALIILSGMLVTSGIAFATPSVIQAFLQPDFRIKINNEFKYHPEGLQPIVYQDRTYLPAAYIAEQLGAKVDYNSETKTITMTSEIPSNNNNSAEIQEYRERIIQLENKISQLENNTEVKSEGYDKLPVRKTQNGYTVTLEGFSVSEQNEGRLYFVLENRSVDTGMRIEPLSTKIEINGKEYLAQTGFDSIDDKLFKWLEIYNDDQRNLFNKVESIVPFRNIPDEENIKEMTITMVVQKNQYLPEKETIVFKVLND